MVQSIPPPPQAANPKTIEVVHHLPPKPAVVTHIHRKLHLVKYDNRYWLEDNDNHCYLAARDHSGHLYPACYDNTDESVYPLYYDPDRDDYYHVCSDHHRHWFRCYEDDPDYVYYWDDDPVYLNGYVSACEPIVYAPAGFSVGISLPFFSISYSSFQPYQPYWWGASAWYGHDYAFVNTWVPRADFAYYTVPAGYTRVYANTLYRDPVVFRSGPRWFAHGAVQQVAYGRAYGSFAGRPGTLAGAYAGNFTRTAGNRSFASAGRAPGFGANRTGVRGFNPTAGRVAAAGAAIGAVAAAHHFANAHAMNAANRAANANRAMMAHNANVARRAMVAHNANVARRAMVAHNANVAHRAMMAHNANVAHRAMMAHNANVAHRAAVAHNAAVRHNMAMAHRNAGATRVAMHSHSGGFGVHHASNAVRSTRTFGGNRSFGGGHSFGGNRSFGGSHAFGGNRSFGGGGHSFGGFGGGHSSGGGGRSFGGGGHSFGGFGGGGHSFGGGGRPSGGGGRSFGGGGGHGGGGRRH
jgi:hypothetical protein